jgi:tetratricopeptide (TPR) repeat protein
MSKYTIMTPRIEEDTTERLVLVTGRSGRLWPVTLLLMAFVIGLGVTCASLSFGDSASLIIAAVFVTIAIVIIYHYPLYVKLTVDGTFRQLIVEKTRLLGLGIFPRRSELTFNSDRLANLEATENLLSTAFGVKLTLSDGTSIILNTRNDGALASIIHLKLKTLLKDESVIGRSTEAVATAGLQSAAPAAGPVAAAGAAEVDAAIPVTGWRLALATVYGLLTAAVAAWVWFLIARTTDTRFGLIALLIGFAVGTVVSLMSGGSRDARYALIGAGLSAVGVLLGELLIFGNIELGYRYELSLLTVFIYLFAVWEGWVIPRRSMRLVRKFSGAVSESNARPLAVAGLILMLAVIAAGLFFRIVPLPDELVASYHSNRAYSHLEQGDLPAAAGELDRALLRVPEWAEGHALLGNVYREAEMVTEAEQAYQKALEQDPELAQAQLGLALLYLSLGRSDEALPLAELAKNDAETRTLAHWVTGYVYFVREQWSLAEQDLALALESDLENTDELAARLMRGFSLLHMAAYREALAVAETVIAVSPDNAYGHLLSGQANFYLGQADPAREALQMALDLGLEIVDAQEARAILAGLDQE